MDMSRNDLLGELANDAALERTDFIVQSTEQLAKFLDRNRERIAQLGGLTLVDDDPDYLSIAPDCTFRVRSRYEDPETGEWATDTEVVDNASELIELYNPAEMFAAFAEAAREAAGYAAEPTATDDLLDAAGVAARGDVRARRRRRLRRRGRLVGRRPAGAARGGRRGGRRALAVQPRARLPGAEPGERGAAARPVRGRVGQGHGPPRRPDHRRRRGRAARARGDRQVPRRGPARGQRGRVARAQGDRRARRVLRPDRHLRRPRRRARRGVPEHRARRGRDAAAADEAEAGAAAEGADEARGRREGDEARRPTATGAPSRVRRTQA